MHLELDGRGALYLQLSRALRDAIDTGRIASGSRMPSTRELATALNISRNTVRAAYKSLFLDHLIDGKVGTGTLVTRAAVSEVPPAKSPKVEPPSRYVARLRKMGPYASRPRNAQLRYDLQYGEPLINIALASAWRKEVARAVGGFEWQYPPSAGMPALRQAIADYLKRRRGVACVADDVIVTSGAQQAVSLVGRVLLDEGDRVGFEDPTYDLASRALEAQGANVIPIPVDADGLRVDLLPASGIKLVLVTPSHQFPTGAVMSLTRRRALLDYASRNSSWIVEDDYDGEYCFEGIGVKALKALDREGRVIYIGTFSKVLFPGLRLGYIVSPGGLRRDLTSAKALDDIASSGLEQIALAALMQDGGFDRHMRRASDELRRRRAALADGLQEHCARHIVPSGSRGGMHLVGWMPGWTVDEVKDLAALAFNEGMGLHPIAPFYRGTPSAGIVLGFASLSPKQLVAATALLGMLLDKLKRPTRAPRR